MDDDSVKSVHEPPEPPSKRRGPRRISEIIENSHFTIFRFYKNLFLRTLRLRLTKIEKHTKNITQAESQLRTFLLRPNVFKMNNRNTDKIIQVKIQSVLSN